MLRRDLVCWLALVAVAIPLAMPADAQSRSPVVEFTGLLGNVDVDPADGRLQLDGTTTFATAFLPLGADVQAVLYKPGDSRPLYSHPMQVQTLYSVFSVIRPQGPVTDYFFKRGGDYVLSMQANGQEMTRLPFSVVIKQTSDEFEPVRVWFAEGPWDQWACLYVPLAAGEDAVPEIWMWRHFEQLHSGGSDVYRVQVMHQGDLVAESKASHVSSQNYQDVRLPLTFAASSGGTPVRLKDLVAQDGQYELLVMKNDQLESAFQLNTSAGKVLAHPRQSSRHQPRGDYLLPRFPGDDTQRRRAGNVFWLKRLPTQIVDAPVKVKLPTAEDRKRWNAPPVADPNRSFELVLTDVETRNDTMLSAGDDIIVFGSGFPKGVRYLNVGDDAASEIPRGDTYNSRVFRACGKKIVLVRDTQVVIYDTETGETAAIDETEVSLLNPRGGLHHANTLHASGNLVVTINDVGRVSDKTIIKVIDVSGDEPTIMPIKNSQYLQSDISSVAVDSRLGIIAVSSRYQKAIYAAPVASFARQRRYELAGYRGVDENQIQIAGKRVIYADEDDKLRELDLASGTTRTLGAESLGRSGNRFVANDKKTVMATTEHFGTRYEMAVGDFGKRPEVIDGSGTKIPNSNGSLGWAGCAAISDDGTVFIAGTPSGGAGVGEYLQVLTDDGWVPLQHDNRLIGAIDVICGPAMLAFKHGSRTSPTMIGYATFGRQVSIPDELFLVTDVPKPVTLELPNNLDELKDYETRARQRIRAEIAAAIDQAEQEMVKGYIRSGKSELEAKRQARIRGNQMRKIQKLPPAPAIE